MATKNPPENVDPPVCACGCTTPVNWMPGKGWAKYRVGHYRVGRASTRRGAILSEETKSKITAAAIRRYAGKRRRDFDPTGPGVYSTSEYKRAKKQLVAGKLCSKCGTAEHVHAHHLIPGNDSTLVPLCRRCHPSLHFSSPTTRRSQPPEGESAPLCKCGCGLAVGWKRVRGWAEYRKGHGTAKVNGKERAKEAPLCGCGCGERTKYRYGKGWNEYKKGHGQRVYGHYRSR